jgi:endonuclease/exonuclease/phosphatase family metal-dependent hydrolase
VASRLAGGTAWRLDPGRGMGQRGVLEVAVDGAPLRIAAVHFKSSMGVVGPEDCGNAAKRMAVAYGLWRRQQGLADTAYLVVGDVNVDPADPAKQGYDRTDDILALAGDEDLVARLLGPAQPADAGHARHGVIDRAFLRPYGTIAAESVRLAEDVPLGGWASDHRPLVVVLDL